MDSKRCFCAQVIVTIGQTCGFVMLFEDVEDGIFDHIQRLLNVHGKDSKMKVQLFYLLSQSFSTPFYRVRLFSFFKAVCQSLIYLSHAVKLVEKNKSYYLAIIEFHGTFFLQIVVPTSYYFCTTLSFPTLCECICT